DRALLLEFDSSAQVLAWTDAVREADLLGVVDIVPAARTILVKLAGTKYLAPTRQRLDRVQLTDNAVAESADPGDGNADVTLDVV
ncbi:allophanate hydrolase, partial [Mycobacterium sp. ITM-2017-0098]